MRDNPFKIQEGSIKDSRVSGWLKNRQSGDYVSFQFVNRAQDLGKFVADFRIRRFFVIFLLCFSVLFSRAIYLQIIRGQHYRDLAEGNRIRTDIITADRGLIYDRFGSLLVRNVSFFFLYLDKKIWQESGSQPTLDDLSLILGVPVADLEARLYDPKNKADKVLLYENVPYEQAIKLLVMSEDKPALRIAYEPRRQYLSTPGLSHVLGYLGAVTEDDLKNNTNYHYNDRIGRVGLEAVYENKLKGQDGKRQVEVDALYHEKNIIALTESQPGQDLVLTIDEQAQKKLTEIMTNLAKTTGKEKMAAVVLDPKDGGVLAMVSLPIYDNNVFTTILDNSAYQKIVNDPNMPLINRVISGNYPLGSVFKLIVATAALQEQIINDKFTVLSTGGVNVSGNFFPDWRPSGHGTTDVYWAIADSVNTFFYSIGGGNNQWLKEGLGVDKIVEYAKKFGLTKATGIDLPGEGVGFLPSKAWKEETIGERWYLGDTYNLSIGQGYLLATPLQAALYTSYFANNGQAFEPHLVKEIKNGETVTPVVSKTVLTNLVDSANLSIVRKAMRETIVSGTAQSLQSVPVAVAGKTGTAQFNRNKTPHSWFSTFAPYEDPKIVMTVIVEEGGDTGWAVTVTRQFMEWYFSQ